VGTYSWIIGGLATFDALVVALVFLLLRSHPFPDRNGRVIMAVVLSGFVVHAVVFFEGAILSLQLATLAAAYLAPALCPSRPQPSDDARGRT
jgi:hypothetical protein